jgi:hypothetical protein
MIEILQIGDLRERPFAEKRPLISEVMANSYRNGFRAAGDI